MSSILFIILDDRALDKGPTTRAMARRIQEE